MFLTTYRNNRNLEHPFLQMDSLLDSMDDFFRFPSLKTAGVRAKTNIHEDSANYFIDMEIPGVDKKDVSIDIKDGYLIISGEKKHSHADKTSNVSEISYGKFTRSFHLPDNIKFEDIKAKQENGVLSITVPKVKEEKKEASLKIEIQ